METPTSTPAFGYKPKIWSNLNKLKLENLIDTGNGTTLQIFSISFRQGYPRLHIRYTNSEAVDFRDKVANIPLDIGMLSFIADSIIEAANDKTLTRSFGMKNKKWVDGKQTDDIVIVGTLTVSRDDQGFLRLLIEVDGKPNISFRLLPSKTWFTITENGVDVTSSLKTSEIYGKTFAKLLLQTVAMYNTMYSDKYDTTIK